MPRTNTYPTGTATRTKLATGLNAASAGDVENYSLGDIADLAILPVFVQLSMSDVTTDITTGTTKAFWFATEAGNLVDVWIGLQDPSSSGDVRIDMNDSGGTVFTTRPLIQATEATNLTGTLAVLDGTISFVKGDKFTFDIDDAGTDAKGLLVTFEYLPT